MVCACPFPEQLDPLSELDEPLSEELHEEPQSEEPQDDPPSEKLLHELESFDQELLSPLEP